MRKLFVPIIATVFIALTAGASHAQQASSAAPTIDACGVDANSASLCLSHPGIESVGQDRVSPNIGEGYETAALQRVK